jgi:hypothetical protein
VQLLRRADKWEGKASINHTIYLWTSENDVAPKYNYDVTGNIFHYIWLVSHDAGVRRIAGVTFDLKHLPLWSTTKRMSPNRHLSYYKVSYDLVISFLTTLEFKVMVDDTVYGSVVAEYV